MIKHIILIIFVALFLGGFCIPENKVIPVKDASFNDWNENSFWYEPWGSSGVHKGIDVFAGKGTDLSATTNGIVLYQGHIAKGGNVVLILGPKWRLHYYAHLDSISINAFSMVSSNQKIGVVGDSGNAKGKPAHLHYAIVTIVPYPWLITSENQGWKKMFYLDPGRYLENI